MEEENWLERKIEDKKREIIEYQRQLTNIAILREVYQVLIEETKAELDFYRRIKEISPLSEFREGLGYHSPLAFEISPLLEFREGLGYHSPLDFTASQSYYSPIISADDMQIEEGSKPITSQTIKTEKKSIDD